MVVALAGILVCATARQCSAFEISLRGFPVPDVAQAEYLGYIRWDYTDKLAGAESLVRLYRTPQGAQFRSISTNGRIWLYYVEDRRAPHSHFHLADGNGDGLFEAKFLDGEKVPIPYWVLSSRRPTEGEGGQ